MTDAEFMRRTFTLASLGLGTTWPNPLVGALIVKDGRVISEGHHHTYGGHHAEVDAFQNSMESLEGATLYVNLEPCCHTDKQTPPCAQRIIKEKIKKVVIANLDPNPKVNGEGIKLLRAAGIEVISGVLSQEGEKLNEVFFHVQKTKEPFIHLKLATTLDGKMAMPSGDSQWITGETARTHAHELRSHHQGIIIGAGTLRKDNPKLNVRLPQYRGQQPYRIVLTESGLLPSTHLLFTDELNEKTLIYTKRKLAFDFPDQQVVFIDTLQDVLKDLFERKLINLMLEGGPKLASQFMQEERVNRVSVYLNPSFMGSGLSALGDIGLKDLNQRPRLKDIQSSRLRDDFYLTGRLY